MPQPVKIGNRVWNWYSKIKEDLEFAVFIDVKKKSDELFSIEGI